jgi:hypothetical protein
MLCATSQMVCKRDNSPSVTLLIFFEECFTPVASTRKKNKKPETEGILSTQVGSLKMKMSRIKDQTEGNLFVFRRLSTNL